MRMQAAILVQKYKPALYNVEVTETQFCDFHDDAFAISDNVGRVLLDYQQKA